MIANWPLIVISTVVSLSSFKSPTLPVEFNTKSCKWSISKLQKLQYTHSSFVCALINNHTCVQGYMRVLPGIGHWGWLQLIIISMSPIQSLPPQDGGGLVHVLIVLITPFSPHVCEHVPTVVNSVHPPLTTPCKKYD